MKGTKEKNSQSGAKTKCVEFFVIYRKRLAFAFIAIATCAILFAADYCLSEMDYGKIISGTLLYVAIALTFGAICALCFLVRRRFLVFAVLLLFVVCLLQIAVNIVYPYSFDDGIQILSMGEVAVRIISGTLQTFTLDADYVAIMGCSDNFGTIGKYVFQTLYGMTAIAAPATGGFAIFALFSQFFPKLNMYFHSYKNTRYVFSELNEYSIAAAESIVEKRRRGKRHCSPEEWKELKSCMIIFTDAYTDSKQENSSELLDRAKKIGAICITTDISELRLYWIPFLSTKKNRKAVYYLMDRCEESNLKAATMLLSDDITRDGNAQNWLDCKHRFNFIVPFLKCRNLKLYVFTQDTEAREIIKKARIMLINNSGNKKESDGLLVHCKVINEYRNLTYQMISGYLERDTANICAQAHADDKDVKRNVIGVGTIAQSRHYPLYYSRIKQENGILDYNTCNLSELNVVIVGGGRIGREFFKTCYWCGQMLADTEKKTVVGLPFVPTRLSITLLSKFSEQTFERLYLDMPEVFKNLDVKKSGNCIEYIDDYFSCKFVSTSYCPSSASEQIDSAGSSGIMFDKAFSDYCLDADYLLVALGDDDLNLQAAHYIKRKMDAHNINELRNVPINYVIENNSLFASLCKFDREDDVQSNDNGCVLNPVGSISSRYSYENILMTDLESRAYVVNQVHDNVGGDFAAFAEDEYSVNSSTASALHFPYKLVTCHILKTMYYKDCSSYLLTNQAGEQFWTQYVSPLYWLEHRRWNAYMRSAGYRCPTFNEYINWCFDGHAEYVKDKEKAERERYRIHPCIVESGANIDNLAVVEDLKAYSVEVALAVIRSVGNNGATSLEEALRDINILSVYSDIGVKLSNDSQVFLQNADVLDKLALVSGNIAYKQYDVEVAKGLYFDEMCKEIRAYVETNERASFIIQPYAEKICKAQISDEKKEHKFEGENFTFVGIGSIGNNDIILVYCKSLISSVQNVKTQISLIFKGMDKDSVTSLYKDNEKEKYIATELIKNGIDKYKILKKNKPMRDESSILQMDDHYILLVLNFSKLPEYRSKLLIRMLNNNH